jgi:hypothetical protein
MIECPLSRQEEKSQGDKRERESLDREQLVIIPYSEGSNICVI